MDRGIAKIFYAHQLFYHFMTLIGAHLKFSTYPQQHLYLGGGRGWENSKKHWYCRSKSTIDLPPNNILCQRPFDNSESFKSCGVGGGGALGSCNILSCPGFQGYGLYCTGYINLMPSQIEGSLLAIIK